MKKESSVPRILGLLVCLAALVLLQSCAPSKTTNENANAALPAPAQATPAASTGQSATWKVTVRSAQRAELGELSLPRPDEPPHFGIEVLLDVEYLGPERETPAPSVTLTSQNRKLKLVSVGVRVLGSVAPSLEDMKKSESPESMLSGWLFSVTQSRAKLRHLKTGDKFFPIYTFEEPKEGGDLLLQFGDVAAIPVKR
jgi:hypothetical protein